MSTSNFIVSARKYRPATFDTVVGQAQVTDTLKNAIKNKHLAQAYLFCGPRGVGKTTCARILAKTLNCFNMTEDIEACDQCESCKAFNESRSYSIHELDAASNNSVDDIRNLIDQVRVPPQVGKYGIYIIDEVHMLSTAAFNAFLKTLEEPPAHAIFILATTEKHKIIPTILSRCQIFDFNRIKVDDAVSYLEKISEKENVTYEPEGLHVIAQKADGGMRDALSIYDQIVSYSGNHITYKHVIENLNVLDYEYYFKMTDAFLDHQVGQAFLLFNEILDKGFDGHNFIAGLSSHLRDLLVCKDPVTIQLLEVGANISEQYKAQAGRCTPDFLFECLDICATCDIGYKSSKNQRLHVELALLRLCHIGIEKKKPDPVEISAPEKDIAPKVVSTTTSAASPKTPPKQVIPSIQIKTALAGASTPKKQETEKEPQNIVTEPAVTYGNQPVQPEAVVTAWNEFAESIKADDSRLYSILTTASPRLKEETKIFFSINSPLQKDAIDRVKQNLLKYLQSKLDNAKISLNIVLLEKPEHKKAFTSEEKFADMCEKNPSLLVLKQKLMLDFE